MTVLSAPVLAAPPTLDYVFPAGARRGATSTVTLGGKVEPGAKIWTSRPDLQFKPTDKPEQFTVEIPKEAAPGACLIRVHNPDGASNLRGFVIGDASEQLETELNDDWRKAQNIEKLPVTLNGQLERSGDVDAFAIRLEKGQTLIADLDSRVLGAPIDATLRLISPAGAELAFSHDDGGLDPLLAFTAPESGAYIIQVHGFVYPPAADVRFAGNKSCIYRLALTTGPYARHAFPPIVRRGQITSVQLVGWNLHSPFNREINAIGATRVADELHATLAGIENPVRIGLSDHPVLSEIEPNDASASAQSLQIPSIAAGRLGKPGDQDRFAFTAKKDEKLSFRLRSGSLGFPMDGALRVESADGKSLASNDDAGERLDASLAFTAPADGQYVVVVSDLMSRGGDDFIYGLEITRPAPDVQAALDPQTVTVAPGASADLKATITRVNSHSAPLAVVVKGLPPGVSATAPEAPKATGAVTVKLIADKDAKPFSGEIQVLIVSTDADAPLARAASIDLRPKEPANEMLIEKTNSLWLTVTASKP